MDDWVVIIWVILYFVGMLFINAGFAYFTQQQLNDDLLQYSIPNESINSSQVFTDQTKGVSFFTALKITTFSPLGLFFNFIFVVIPLLIVSIVGYKLIRKG